MYYIKYEYIAPEFTLTMREQGRVLNNYELLDKI